uniref:KH domain-containing protein n=1 Tax=Parastrongyloides trichosuri TaxID=131310 RepID=A0A0N4Z6Z8_PARTI
MAANTPSSPFLNSTIEDTTGRYYNKPYRRRNSWRMNGNLNYKDYNTSTQSSYDRTSGEFKKYYTTVNNEFSNTPIAEAFCLPPSHQMPMERYYKILCTVTLMANNQVGSSMNLTRAGLIDRASDIIKRVCLIQNDDIQSLKVLDMQLQEIEEVTTNMAQDLGLTVISTSSLRILKSPENTIVNMCTFPTSHSPMTYEPVLVSDDKTVMVNRDYNCVKLGEIQVQVIKKINLKNCTNVNVIGRLIGPRGSTIKDLENSTQSKITIKGRGSMKNSVMEEDLLRQGTCEHLNEPLHILISVRGVSEVDCYKKLEHVRKKLLFILCQRIPSITYPSP